MGKLIRRLKSCIKILFWCTEDASVTTKTIYSLGPSSQGEVKQNNGKESEISRQNVAQNGSVTQYQQRPMPPRPTSTIITLPPGTSGLKNRTDLPTSKAVRGTTSADSQNGLDQRTEPTNSRLAKPASEKMTITLNLVPQNPKSIKSINPGQVAANLENKEASKTVN